MNEPAKTDERLVSGEAMFAIDDLVREAQANTPVGLPPETVDAFCEKYGPHAAYRLGYRLAVLVEHVRSRKAGGA